MISKSMSVVLSSSLYPRVYPVHLMSVIQCQVSIDPQTKPTQFGCKYACRQLSSTFTITTTVVRPFSGTIRWADARRELLDFMVQGKINTGRHTQTIRLGATPSGLTSAHLHHPHIHHHHLLSLKETMMLCVHWQYKKIKKIKATEHHTRAVSAATPSRQKCESLQADRETLRALSPVLRHELSSLPLELNTKQDSFFTVKSLSTNITTYYYYYNTTSV